MPVARHVQMRLVAHKLLHRLLKKCSSSFGKFTISAISTTKKNQFFRRERTCSTNIIWHSNNIRNPCLKITRTMILSTPNQKSH